MNDKILYLKHCVKLWAHQTHKCKMQNKCKTYDIECNIISSFVASCQMATFLAGFSLKKLFLGFFLNLVQIFRQRFYFCFESQRPSSPHPLSLDKMHRWKGGSIQPIKRPNLMKKKSKVNVTEAKLSLIYY